MRFVIACCCSTFLFVLGYNHRLLATGDFAELNEILKDALIYLGDITVADDFLLSASVSNLRCTEFSIGDVTVSSRKVDFRNVYLDIGLKGLDMTCYMDYSYTNLLVFAGSGRAVVKSKGSSASVITQLRSPDLNRVPPTSATLEDCAAQVKISELDFLDGGIIALSPVESLIARGVQNQASKSVCKELSDFSESGLVSILKNFKDSLAEYPANFLIDAMSSEKNLVVPDNIELLDLYSGDSESDVSEVVELALEEGVSYLSERVEDPVGFTSDGKDMRINVLLRDILLENDRSLLLNVSDFAFAGDGVMFEEENRLTNTKITLNSVKLFGIDTFSRFQPLNPIGNYTLQNELSWEYINFELDATISVKASRAPDSIILNPGSKDVMERVTITFGVENLDAVASFLLAINQDVFESLKAGSLLNFDDLVPCIMSALFQVDTPAFSISLSDIKEPVLDNFVSPGLDRLATGAALAAFQVYEPLLLKSAPAFFQIAVRGVLNDKIQEIIEGYRAIDCPQVDVDAYPGSYIDFRDLMLDPESSSSMGGNGTEPYGDVIHTVYTDFNDRFIIPGEDGLPKINDAIRPATAAQSGKEGALAFLDPFNFVMENATSFKSLVEKAVLKSSSIVVSNLDTITQPLDLLSVAGAHNLNSAFRLGAVSDRPLTVSTDMHVKIEGEDSPLSVDNAFEITITLQNSLAFDIIVYSMKEKFLEFRLMDILNLHCWLAVLPTPDINAQGYLVDPSSYKGFDLSQLEVAIDALDFDIKCTKCTSFGGQALPEILSTLKNSGGVEMIRQNIEKSLDETMHRYWDSFEMHNKISKAHLACPSSPYYDPQENTSFEWPKLPSLSKDSVESLVSFAGLALNFAIALTAKSHLLKPAEPTDPMSGEVLLLSEKEELVDWSDIGNSIGDWADSAIDEFRSSIVSPVMDNLTGEQDIRANVLIREWLEGGILSIDLEDSKFENEEIGLELKQIRIIGLDSIVEADLLNGISARTLSNKLIFEMLHVEVVVGFEIESSYDEATLSFEVNNVDVDTSLLLAVNLEELGSMKVGSVLSLRNIIPCLVPKLHAVDLTQFLLSPTIFNEPYISGFLSESRQKLLESSTRQFFQVFQDDVVAAIPKIMDGTVRKVLNQILLDFLTKEDVYCSYISEVKPNGVVDFRDFLLSKEDSKAFGGSGDSPYGDTVPLAFQALQKSFREDNDEQESALNDMIRSFTSGQSNVTGSLIFPGEVFNYSESTTLSNWNISVIARVSNVRIENLDSLGQPLKLLQPVDGQASVLNNTISMGVGPEPLRMIATLFLSLVDGNEMNIQNEIEVVLEMKTLSMALSVFLAMSEASLFDLSLTDLQQVDCLLSTVNLDSLSEESQSRFLYSFSAESANLDISCVSCGSPRFDELIQKLYRPGDSPEEIDQFVAETQELFDNFAGSDFLRTVTKKIVSEASLTCPASPNYKPSAASANDFWATPGTYLGFEPSFRDKNMKLFNFVMALIAGFILVAALIGQFLLRQNNRKWMDNLPEDQADLLRLQDKNEEAKEKYLNQFTTSMFKSDYVPVKLRYAVPAVIVCNILFYVAAHILVLCYINVEAQIAGEQFTIENFLDFRFFEATLRTYHNGGNEMAIFLITFSGIWPYIKLTGALIIWFMPPDRLSVARREKLLLWMDALTRLSIIDIVTMLIAVAALLVYLGGPGEEFYGSDQLYAMTVVVVPQAGFYCILIAQRLNRVSSRFFLDYHHKIVLGASKEYRSNNNRPRFFSEDGVSRSERTQRTLSGSSFEISHHGSISFEDSPRRQRSELGRASISSSDSGLIYRQTNDPLSFSNRSHEHEVNADPSRGTCTFQCRKMLGGTFGVVLAGITILIFFIIGCVLAPSGSLDVQELLSLGLESGRTYADAVDDFNVFRMVSLVLLKARFVLSSSVDYVGLGILLTLGVITIVLFPLSQGWKRARKWWNEREARASGERKLRKSIIPGFTNRLKVYHHMEVYIVSFCIAIWQLGAVVAYCLHNYCFMLKRFYEALAYIGLVEKTESNCFRRQALDPLTMIIGLGSFLLLLVSFITQIFDQLKKNKEKAGELLIEERQPKEGGKVHLVQRVEPVQVVVRRNLEPFDVLHEEDEGLC